MYTLYRVDVVNQVFGDSPYTVQVSAYPSTVYNVGKFVG